MRNEESRRTKTDDMHRWVRYGGPPFPSEILEFGFDNPRQALTLTEHVHENAFEFVVIEKGHAAWELGAEQFHTRTGDVFHTRPGEVHRGGYEVIEPCRFWWIQIVTPIAGGPREPLRDWLSIPHEELTPLVAALTNLPRVHHCGTLVITKISFDLGYATSQHFATVFRRITGQSPSQWRRK